MRNESANTLKMSLKRRRYRDVRQKEPLKGSELRRIYNRFMASKGKPIKFYKGIGSEVENLKNFYGLDIRIVRRTKSINLKKGTTWVLAGEYEGADYKDYITERLKNGNR